MTTRWIGPCIALVAATASAYPVTIANRTTSEISRRRADFIARNPGHWIDVQLDEHGFVTHAETDNTTLANADLVTLREFARHNADLFGMPLAAADRLATNPAGDAEVDDAVDGALLGVLQLHHAALAPNRPALTIDATFWIEATPTVSKADVAKRLDGQSYTDATTYGGRAKLDCAMTPAGVAGCATTTVGTIRQNVKLAAKDVRISTTVQRVGTTYRLVRCADDTSLPPPPPDLKWGRVEIVSRSLTPIAGAPVLPLAIDAVTGEVIAARSCDELRSR